MLSHLRSQLGSKFSLSSQSSLTGSPVHASAAAEVAWLAPLIPVTPGKRDFLRQVDAFQQGRIDELAAAYDNRALARLVLLKVGNLLVSQHGFHHRHTQLAGRPTQIMLDPSNTCQLQCPGCVHSSNATAGYGPPGDGRIFFEWPKGVMPPGTFDRIMSDYAPFAFAAVMYNYGEPLINKQFPDMVRRAKALGLYTWTSSNLSLSFDVDGVVGSDLDLLTMSIDGTSQETLQHYRRRGKYDLCLANMRALVAAKRRLGGGPHLVWQFLTFAHNSHEIETALALAQEIGVDELNVVTPLDMTWDDPTVPIHKSERAGRYVFNEDRHLTSPAAAAGLAIDEAVCDGLLSERWVDRMDRLGIQEEPSRAGRATCDWLYQNVTFDSADRVMPCCMAPTTTQHLHFATLGAADGDVTNSDEFRRARLAFVDRAAYDADAPSHPGREPHCANCKATPTLNFPVNPHVAMQLQCLDQGRVFDAAAINSLTGSTPAGPA
ncbi:radical SAM protein [Limobrevibacterium gyesilva]|nr:hypothetical protein [Limobrevibacterium gyesilva]